MKFIKGRSKPFFEIPDIHKPTKENTLVCVVFRMLLTIREIFRRSFQKIADQLIYFF